VDNSIFSRLKEVTDGGVLLFLEQLQKKAVVLLLAQRNDRRWSNYSFIEVSIGKAITIEDYFSCIVEGI
jgi:hypothetical protein